MAPSPVCLKVYSFITVEKDEDTNSFVFDCDDLQVNHGSQ